MPQHALATTPDQLVRLFDGLKAKTGGGYTARCPAHDDRLSSLSIDIRDGKILLKCFAGCDTTVVAAAKGLTMADLFLDDAAPLAAVPLVPTVESLAVAKGLPLAILQRYGVRNVADLTALERLQYGIRASEGVWIPYYHQDGSIAARTRLRTAHRAGDGSRWCGSFGAPIPYGLQDLADATTQWILVLCEGETDYWSLRAMGVPAIGLPGASTIGSLQRAHVPAGVTTVYIAQDSDAAGATFAAGLTARVDAWGLSCVAVTWPPGCKDVNDFYRLEPATAADRLMARMADAAAGPTVEARTFSTAGEIYRYTLPEYGLVFEIDLLQRKWGDLVGELAVTLESGDDVFRGTVNLSNVERRQGVVGQIARRAHIADVAWPELMEDFAIRCLRAERAGRPGVWLDEVTPRPAGRLVRVLGGIDLPVDLPSCLFGDGDTGKSFLALAILAELTTTGFVCGIIDAEMEDTIHAGRLRMLCGSTPPRVAHLRVDRALAQSVDAVRRFVRDRGVTFLVYDSVGFLTPEPEQSESALAYMRAVRQIGCGSLSIAHVTKASRDAKPHEQKPFGSNFYYQSFRGLWYAQAESEADGAGRKLIAIYDRKGSVKGKRPPCGVALTIVDGHASVASAEITESPDLTATLPAWRQIAAVLRQPRTKDEVVEATGLGLRTVESALQRGRQRGAFVLLDGPDARWALATRAAQH